MTFAPPPHVLPNAFLYEIIFVTILAISFVLLAKYSSFRKFAPFLVLVGIVELAFSLGTAFMEGMIISFVTIIGGAIIPALSATKLRLSSNSVKFSIILAGCAELILGFVSLYFSGQKWWVYQFVIGFSINGRGYLLLVGMVLLILGVYTSIIGTAIFFAKSYKRRNISIIAIIAVIFLVLAVYIGQFSVSPPEFTHAFAHLNLYTKAQYSPDENNSITLNGVFSTSVLESDPCNFYVVITCENASFLNQTKQPFLQANGTSVKLLFLLHENGAPTGSENKTVFFSIDKTVASFSFLFNLEKYKQDPIPGISPFVYRLDYEWNAISSCFEERSRSIVD